MVMEYLFVFHSKMSVHGRLWDLVHGQRFFTGLKPELWPCCKKALLCFLCTHSGVSVSAVSCLMVRRCVVIEEMAFTWLLGSDVKVPRCLFS